MGDHRLSVCLKRLIIWLVLAGSAITVGIILDLVLGTEPFPVSIRLVGLLGMLGAHFPLKRTGRLLKRWGEQAEWGCTSRLITTDIYQCVRHPHHVAVGIFMTFLGLFMGHLYSFVVVSVSQWLWVILFVVMVEEKELVEKFGHRYQAYCRKVPMLVPKPICFLKLSAQSLPKESEGEPGSSLADSEKGGLR